MPPLLYVLQCYTVHKLHPTHGIILLFRVSDLSGIILKRLYLLLSIFSYGSEKVEGLAYVSGQLVRVLRASALEIS